MSKIKKAVEPKVMAPNDPNRIPLAHRKLVNELFEILDENSYNIYDAQVITQTLSILARGKDMSKNMTTLVQLVEAVTKVENGERDIEAILQIQRFDAWLLTLVRKTYGI